MPTLEDLFWLVDVIVQFVSQNFGWFAIIGIGCLAVVFIRRWPDVATFTFLKAGIRAGDHVETYRRDLAHTIAELSKRLTQAVAEQRLRIQAIHMERERIEQLVRTNPRLVKEVGQTLHAVEREYLNSLKVLKSEQAKEALRRATEKRINDLLQSLDIQPTDTPSFYISSEKEA